MGVDTGERCPQNHDSVHRAKTVSSGAFGPFLGVETTKSGGWHGEKVPSESRFGPSSPRYSQFSGSDVAKSGHVWAQHGVTDTVRGHKLVKTGQNDNPDVARVDSSTEHGQWTPPAPVLEPPGPLFGAFGPLGPT